MSLATEKTAFKNSVKALLEELSAFDGTTGKTREDSIEKFSEDLTTLIYNYIKTALIYSTPAQVTSAGMVAGITPVIGVGNLISIIE
jgi:hypothetical protein